MYFLVQSNIHVDPDHHRIFDALEELGIDYEKIELKSSDETISVNAARKDVFVYGSVKLARLAKQNRDWYPGSFYGGNHLFEVYSHYYTDNLLNYGYEVFPFSGTITWEPDEEKFIKPYQDAKIFTGKTFQEKEWNDFVASSLFNPRTPLLTAKSLVQISKPQYIEKEARLWIVGGEIVEAVYYKFHSHAIYEDEVAPDGLDFAKRMLVIFQVAEAFVMDICLTFDGWKIVEINCVNSAGFYPNVNVKSLVKALNTYFSS